MMSFEAAVERAEFQLRFIPLKFIRQRLILAVLKKFTASHLCALHLHDDIGRFIGGTIWPLSPVRLAKMVELGPAFSTLGLCGDLYERYWDARPGTAFELPDGFFLNSLIYQFIYSKLDCRHAIICPYKPRTNGSSVVVYACRNHEAGTPYSRRDLRRVEVICERFESELESVEPAGPLLPRHAVETELFTELDPELRPGKMSLHLQAMLACFYGGHRLAAEGRVLLPAALEADIVRHREAFLRTGRAAESGEFHLAFTKAHRGRVLCLAVHSRADASSRLVLHEDHTQIERLSRIKAACRELPRDRTAIFSACLVLAEGIRRHEEIAARIGLSRHKASSTLRIVSRARAILETL